MNPSPSSSVADRTRFLACAMGFVCLTGSIGWFWPFDDLLDRQGTPLGADFSMFYTTGRLVSDGSTEKLYDQQTHQERLHQLFPGLAPSFCLPFRYPPAVALLLAPLSRFPYPVAWGGFTLLSCVAYAVSLYLISHLGDGWRSTGIWTCLGWPVAWEVLIGGQASMLALAIAVIAIHCLTRDRLVLAGAVLALSAYKPNVLACFAIGIAMRYPRVLLGAIPVLVAFAGLSCLAGTERLAEYLQLTLNLSSGTWDVETPFWKAHSLAPFLETVIPGHGRLVTVIAGMTAAALIAIAWRRADADVESPSQAQSFSLAALLAVNAVLNPYTPIYDLILLAPAGWLVARGFETARGRTAVSATAAQCWLAVLFFGPHLSQALARPLGLQVFPLALSLLCMWVIYSSQVLPRARCRARPVPAV